MIEEADIRDRGPITGKRQGNSSLLGSHSGDAGLVILVAGLSLIGGALEGPAFLIIKLIGRMRYVAPGMIVALMVIAVFSG